MAPAAARRVTIPYSPRRQFLGWHERVARFSAIVAHRRAGKTVACINDLIRDAWVCKRPEPRFAYIAPLFNQAKDVAWSYLKHYASPLLAAPPNETELRVDLVNGARIRLYGADNPDRLRGIYLDGVVLDEYADMAPNIWGEVIRPLLADRQGRATFIGTPKGRNQFYDVVIRARTDSDWHSMTLRASETGLIAKAELESARRDMTPEQYEQEFECSFEAAILGAYYGREMVELEKAGRICALPCEAGLPVHTAWDLGIGDSMSIWMFQIGIGEIRVIDHYENHGYPIAHYIAELQTRPYTWGTDWVPHDAKVRSLETGRTRVETLKQLNRAPDLVPDHKFDDGVEATRRTLHRVWFDETRCKLGIEALRQYRRDWDEKLRVFKDTPKRDWTTHAADAFRYMCMAWRELAQAQPAEAPRVLRIGQPSTITMNDLWEAQERRNSEDE